MKNAMQNLKMLVLVRFVLSLDLDKVHAEGKYELNSMKT